MSGYPHAYQIRFSERKSTGKVASGPYDTGRVTFFILRNNGRTSEPITRLSTKEGWTGEAIYRASPLVQSAISL